MTNILRKGLGFDFKAMGEQSATIDPIISFSRASTATRISPVTDGLVETVAANVARINGRQELWKAGCKNLLPYSEDLDSAAWNNNGGYGTIGTASKVGYVAVLKAYAYKFTMTAGGNQGRRVNLVKVTNGAQYTVSFHAKRDGNASINFYVDAAVVGIGVSFNFESKAIAGFGGTSNHVYTELAGGWFRVSFTFTAPNDILQVGPIEGTDATYQIAAVQLEAGGAVTMYEPNPVVTQPGLLIEEQKTNLTQNSTPYQGGNWGSNNWPVITSGSSTSPDGTQTATYVSGSGSNDLYHSVLTTGFTTTSIWGKAITSSAECIYGILSQSGGQNMNKIKLTSEWQRFYATGNVGSAPGWVVHYLQNISGSAYLWGAQTETGTFPSSFIPTQNSLVTRSADFASVDISKIWNQSEGTIICETDLGYIQNIGYRSIFDTTDPELINVYRSPNTQILSIGTVGGISTFDANQTNTGRNRFALALRPQAITKTINGSSAETFTVTRLPSPPDPYTLYIGTNRGNSEHLNGTIQYFGYYPFAIDDYTLKALSTIR